MAAFRIEFPPELPISARASEITDLIASRPVLILAGETGSGKTTQIPKMCLAAGRGQAGLIACTQPRRVAALSISRRVAEELNVEWGRQVGCKIRFDDRTSRDTIIKFMTDGMLLAEVQSDPMLRAYDTIILDEAHERSLNIDFLLGHLRNLRFKRPELKIIITSATIDTQVFSRAFDDAPIVEVSGRTWPVEVIYEPLDGLGDDSAEGDEPESRAEALHYIDGAVEAVERIVRASDGSRAGEGGDILVFMPAERDIRETRELLEGRKLRNCEVVPLFGRLSNADQQRVFAPSLRRKIIVATNIAETSLTLPGIRFVIDTGLARVSRYSPQARTRRLPIEPVAQSSADQRKGRAGRVAEGVCIRLYSEKDYNERPRFAQPEIQRANLADVILRMKAFGLGDIERFPFINMPAAKSIRAGYALLDELGALEKPSTTSPPPPAGATTTLTPLGRELARLPVDPTVGRMILQARIEKSMREVLVIAAGLSIQDPRERPLDAREKADAAHRRFAHPDSDFLTLLNIWDAFHDEFERLSQSRLRRFCKEHFLSYTRLREWRDVHAQLLDVLEQRRDFRLTSVHDGLQQPASSADPLAFGTPAYRAIHRSILAGLLGNIACRDDENGGYKATNDRRVTLFPGSVLHRRDRDDRPGKRPPPPPSRTPADKRGPRWLMAAEIMETTRLYARTCARLDPLWALELGAHVVRVSHSDPFWNEQNGRVLVKQRTRLHGLELESRAVAYGRINPAHATEIFIREALVNDTLTWPFAFLEHNRALRSEIENLLTRTRDASYLNLDEALYRYYAARLLPDPGVSSVHELIKLTRERAAAEPDFLKLQLADLRDPEELRLDATAYPETLALQNTALPLNYAYKPGQTDDGVTLDVNHRAAAALTPAALDWAIPGHLPALIEHHLRALPKELRRAFVPLADTAQQLATAAAARARLTDHRETLAQTLAALIEQKYRVRLDPAHWDARPPPDHLRVRIRVTDDAGAEICASRNLDEIHAQLAAHTRAANQAAPQQDPENWRRARARWERPGQTTWTFGDIPPRVPLGTHAGVDTYAYPGLHAPPPPADTISLRLFKTPEAAHTSTHDGIRRLLELHLRHKLAWLLKKDLRALRELGPLTATLVSINHLQDDAYTHLQRWLTDPARLHPDTWPTHGLRAAAFETAAAQAERDLQGIVPRLTDQLREILTLRQTLLVHPTPPPGHAQHLATLLPPTFLRTTPPARLQHFPRYLRAMKLRADRWRQNQAKDADRARNLAPYEAQLTRDPSPLPPAARDTLRWLVEELRVSLFAQELGTTEPISPVKLDRLIAAWRRGGANGAGDAGGRAGEPAPIVASPIAKPEEKKAPPLKSFGALDGLFGGVRKAR